MKADQATVAEVLRDSYDSFTSAEKRVADYILANPQDAMVCNVAQLAKKSEVSDATIVRMCQRAGYTGYYQMHLLLSHDVGQRATPKRVASPRDSVAAQFERGRACLESIQTASNRRRIANVAKMLAKAPEVIAIGVGNSVPIALDLAFRLSRIGVRATASIVYESGVNHIVNALEGSVVVAVSKSGISLNVLDAVELARKRGMKVVAITGDLGAQLAKRSNSVVFSGDPDTYMTQVQSGLESHLGELAVIDAILVQVVNIRRSSGENVHEYSDAIELTVSSTKL